MFRQVAELKPDVIYVGGDIVHSKTQGISPELIDILNWWFTGLAELAPTHVILGNHDGLVLNKHRQDAITPIIKALDNPRIHLYKKSGIYPTGIAGINWGVFSCFDEEGWEDVKPVKGEINIALYHGGVQGSATDIDWQIDGEVDAAFFDGFDFAFLGDIHKVQYLDDEKRIAYCGSTIQQNYGEDPGKGFLYWEIDDRDNFKSTFYPVIHKHPFVTLDWDGDAETILDAARQHPNESRYRIRANDLISQAEIKQLYAALKKEKKPYEIVFKYEQHDEFRSAIQTADGEIFHEDLRDPKTHVKLLKNYYSESDISLDTWERIEKLVTKYVNQLATQESTVRNTRFSIKRLQFDNLFLYGKENVVNFDNLNGITGIFGKNRSGKSSIAGALMYTLFNTTDRGPIKNLHVINSRKGHCLGEVDFVVNGNLYRAERQSVKHQTRAGKVHAVTHLNLSRLNSAGEVIQDLNGEQRRETEKTMRTLVGTADDFLLTSLASQGEMNTFIKNRATQRKAILNKFLDLDVFEKMAYLAKEDSADIKGMLKNVPDKDWDTLIAEKEDRVINKQLRKEELDSQYADARANLEELNITLATHKDKDAVTQRDVDDQVKKIEKINSTLAISNEKIQAMEKRREENLLKIERISTLKEQFPINELKEQLEIQRDLEKSLLELEHVHEKEKTILKEQKKSVKRLGEVPCGDKYPTCKFIKDSHSNKSLMESQQKAVNELISNVRASRRALKKIEDQQLQVKIDKYDDVLKQEAELLLEDSRDEMLFNQLLTQKSKAGKLLSESENNLSSMKLRVSSDSNAKAVSSLRRKIQALRDKIAKLDAKRISASESIALLQKEIKTSQSEKIKYGKLYEEWRCYDIMMGAFSKKGIPLQIITSQLPIINAEISKILQGVVGFTVELSSESGSNDMDIVINYGDSQRIIECASGMEKMMASLAIRVALINISCLPKTNMLIIDEGFGALDEMNVEACNRLLNSLKKWFKNIMVISHVDAVKDAVDNVLDITSVGKDAKIVYE
tara:strand:- start:146758 stop:149820 length:3063 start_codon:yes stop_codon:yes gene_type:complete